MRECWINVYERRYGGICLSREFASQDEAKRRSVLRIEVGFPPTLYRLHVRLKVPTLPATDALAAVKAGEDERRRHHGAS